MKKNIKKRVLTGIAAIALVAPLVLSGTGMNNANAAQTVTTPQVTTGASAPSTSNQTNSNNSQGGNNSQLAAIRAQIQAQYRSMQNTIQQYRKKYQSIPKNDKSQQKALISQYENQTKPAQQKLTSLQKEYTNTMTPEQRKQAQQKQQAAQKQIMQNIQKQMKAQQQKEKAKMLKTAQSLFLVQGNKVYTVKADLGKNGSAKPVPGTMKKYTSLKHFARIQRQAIFKAQLLYRKARSSRNSKVRKRGVAEARALYMKYGRVGQIPTKQQQAKAKQAAKAQKNVKRNVNRKNVKKRHVKNKRIRRNHKHNHRSVSMNRRKIRNRIKHSNSKRGVHRTKRDRRRSGSFNVNEFGRRVTLLRSEFKRGNYRAAKRSGFVRGRDFSDGLSTMFDRYRPNSRRAVIPKNYKIYKVNINNKNHNQRATVWLVGRRNNNIANMKQAYYYGYNNNKHYGGWRNIGA